MGIGMLVLLIALIMVAAIVAGVLISTSGAFQEKALTTGDQSKTQIATNLRFMEIVGTDGRNNYLSDFTAIVRLAAGSEAVEFEDLLLMYSSDTMFSSLEFAGTDAGLTNDIYGYYTWHEEVVYASDASAGVFEMPENDYDADGMPDNLFGGNDANLYLNLSSGFPILLGSCSGGNFASEPMLANEYLKDVRAECNASDHVMSVTLVPQNISKGYYSIEHMHRTHLHVPGVISTGEIIRIYFQAPERVYETQKISLSLVPKAGSSTQVVFTTDDVIAQERVQVFP